MNIRISPELFLFLKDNFQGNIQGKPTTYITRKRISELIKEDDIDKDLLKKKNVVKYIEKPLMIIKINLDIFID